MGITESILESLSRVYGKIFGSANDRELKKLWPLVEQVREAWEPIRKLPDEALSAKTAEFRRRLIAGESEDDILPEAFAACREASHRTLGGKQMVTAKHHSIVFRNGEFKYEPVVGEIPLFAHFDVQVLGGIVLHQGKISEMVTGEGKTLVATLPTYLNALRVPDEWVEKAKELQGENTASWVFKPYGLFIDEDKEEWRLLDRLVPDPADVTWREPEAIIPVSRGVHIITVNDYLAKRDAEYNRPLFEFMGIQIGAIQADMDSRERIPIYMGDVTYGTNNEFGFDYLRDNLKVRREHQVQRSRFFAIVDEVDSVLIDEARTPLIISGSAQEATDKYYLADRVARKLNGGEHNAWEEKIAGFMKQGMQREDARMAAEESWDYIYSERDHSAKLTERGMNQVLRILGMDDLYSGENLDIPHYIDNALRAHAIYKKDTDYIVKDGQVYIVDEFTGRVLEGRRWSDGLHQAVEAKEHLRIKEESQTVATITFQNFFKLYERLGGMTGTAMTEAKEFHRIYNLGVVNIPTNRPLRRMNHPDLIFGTAKEKYVAIAEEVMEVHKTGRPILIGTVSIERSEIISEFLTRRGVKHEVLNAKHHAREAEIVSQAGQFGAVTVATNMAGRGTDIVLGKPSLEEVLEHWQRWNLVPKKGVSANLNPEQLREILIPHWAPYYLRREDDKIEGKGVDELEQMLRERWKELGMHEPVFSSSVAEMGGLHIIGTERHEARRIDNQLRGRAGRQGDPGSSRFFLSLEDDTMRMFAPDKAKRFMQWAGLKDGMPIESRMVSRTVENAQRKVEERNFEIRKNLLEYDQVMNEQRLLVYERRQAWLEGRLTKESMLEYCQNFVDLKVEEITSGYREEWDLSALTRFMEDTFFLKTDVAEFQPLADKPDPDKLIADYLCEKLKKAYEEKEKRISPEIMRLLEKMILLETIDRKWMDHLYAMDLLKEGIHLWGYAQQDPKIRYKREGYGLFKEMWESLEGEVADLVMKVTPAREMEVEEQVKVEATVHDDFNAFAGQADAIGADAGERHHEPIVNEVPKVKPNQPCPCGSGKKYKKCCGRS
jgi:preprotein translocase subunit SecA